MPPDSDLADFFGSSGVSCRLFPSRHRALPPSSLPEPEGDADYAIDLIEALEAAKRARVDERRQLG